METITHTVAEWKEIAEQLAYDDDDELAARIDRIIARRPRAEEVAIEFTANEAEYIQIVYDMVQ